MKNWYTRNNFHSWIREEKKQAKSWWMSRDGAGEKASLRRSSSSSSLSKRPLKICFFFRMRSLWWSQMEERKFLERGDNFCERLWSLIGSQIHAESSSLARVSPHTHTKFQSDNEHNRKFHRKNLPMSLNRKFYFPLDARCSCKNFRGRSSAFRLQTVLASLFAFHSSLQFHSIASYLLKVPFIFPQILLFKLPYSGVFNGRKNLSTAISRLATSSLSRIHYVRQTSIEQCWMREEIVEAKFSMKMRYLRKEKTNRCIESCWLEARNEWRERRRIGFLIFRWLRKRVALETEQSNRAPGWTIWNSNQFGFVRDWELLGREDFRR